MRKLKIAYLLLGMGIGIILINGLYSIYPQVKYKELSEEMIIERAEELGYISLKEKIIIEKDELRDGLEEIKLEEIEEIEEPGVEVEQEPEEIAPEILEELEEEKSDEEESIEIEIESRDNLSDIAKKLFDAKLIEDVEEFRSLVRDKGVDKKLRDGVYKIKHNTSYDDIIKLFTN